MQKARKSLRESKEKHDERQDKPPAEGLRQNDAAGLRRNVAFAYQHPALNCFAEFLYQLPLTQYE